jgi:hypothetical protein
MKIYVTCRTPPASRWLDADYQAFFPRGSRFRIFYPDARFDGLTTFQDYVLRWHRLRSPFGPLSLREIEVGRVKEFRRRLIASGLTGKSVTNIIGMLHKVMTDATEGSSPRTPVLRIRSGRAAGLPPAFDRSPTR